MNERPESAGGKAALASLINREIVQLAVLAVIAVVAFFLTRAVAADNHNTRVRDAAEWYGRGQEQLHANHLDAAIATFRRATARDRSDRAYMFALADALARNHDGEA